MDMGRAGRTMKAPRESVVVGGTGPVPDADVFKGRDR
jgi:hypothetical protein